MTEEKKEKKKKITAKQANKRTVRNYCTCRGAFLCPDYRSARYRYLFQSPEGAEDRQDREYHRSGQGRF